MKVIMASDHGGFTLKEKIKKTLSKTHILFEDFGAKKLDQNDDYQDFIIPAMTAILKNKNSKGIIICRNGVGVSILANKFKGIRAGLCFSENHVKSARNDDDINVLALPANYISKRRAMKLVKTFLNTPFSGEARHKRRLAKI